MSNPKYWTGTVPANDGFSMSIENVFYDAATRYGSWATMTPGSWEKYRMFPDLGTGKGQKYEKQADGRWLLTEGQSA